jgi:hypothetical protein
MIRYLEEDIEFLIGLLTAPIYQAKTPNLYENLKTYQSKFRTLSSRIDVFKDKVAVFEKSLETYPEEDNSTIDEYYHEVQTSLIDNFTEINIEFLELKSKLYAFLSGAMLKQNKISL